LDREARRGHRSGTAQPVSRSKSIVAPSCRAARLASVSARSIS